MIGILVLTVLYLWWTVESIIDMRNTRKHNKDANMWWNEKDYNYYTLTWMWFTFLAIFALCVSDLYRYFNK